LALAMDQILLERNKTGIIEHLPCQPNQTVQGSRKTGQAAMIVLPTNPVGWNDRSGPGPTEEDFPLRRNSNNPTRA
jgi:hypothetical protein